MKISDYERLKKIVKTWEKLNNEIEQRGITKDKLLNDEFMQNRIGSDSIKKL